MLEGWEVKQPLIALRAHNYHNGVSTPSTAERSTRLTPLKRLMRAALNRIGYDVTRVQPLKPEPRRDGFPRYVAEAKQAGTDVNDWLETVLRWEPALPILRELVFPYLDSRGCVCEIGPGTGRQARHIIPRIQQGTVHLFDHFTWVQDFLRHYFAAYRNVTVHPCDGRTLDLPNDSVDLVFSDGAFTEMKLGAIFLYSREFARICKRKSYVIFDYVDISTSEGWSHLESQSSTGSNLFTYHCGHVIDKLFANAGFTLMKRHQCKNSTYVVFTKE
jgi:hypothetical protein